MEYKGKIIGKRAVGVEAEFGLYPGWYISGHCSSKETVQSIQFSSRDESRLSRINGKKTLNTGDSGQSIFLALSHFTCKPAALRMAAQGITSKNVYKILAKGFLFVSFQLKNFPSAIGLYANWSSISPRLDWGIYCSRFQRFQHLTIKSVTGWLFWLPWC